MTLPIFSEIPDVRPPARGRFEIAASAEALILVAALFWTLAANRSFFAAAMQDRSIAEPSSWGFAAALAVMLVAVHVLLLSLVAFRWTVKPLLAVLIVATAFALHWMQRYGVYLDTSMLRNVLRTDVGEARELFTWTLLPHLLLYAVLPLALLWRVRVTRRPWKRALAWRAGLIVGAAAVLVGTLLAVYQPMASLMRNHKEVRFLITPANYVWSLGSVIAADAKGAAKPRQPIGLDAKPGPSWAAQQRPRVLVLVVGETARAANWGLNGYERQTTPELAKLGIVNFREVSSCGTNTEVSVPCMFAPVGRRDYDESRIRGSESLLHVLNRAGVAVQWRDNQSGCKGVCEGLPSETVSAQSAPGLCEGDRCADEGLLVGLDERLARAAGTKGTQLYVLHMLGNHGPSYFRRYPSAFERFQPACKDDDLRRCSREQIVNAYDNALLYTDHVLASLIAKLQAHAGSVDAAMLYVSDHGESLGENGLFLHGLPYAIAPEVQKRVPMVYWSTPGFGGVDAGCLRQRAESPASHDHLFHTVLGLLDVQTSLYAAEYDLGAGCRGTRAAP